MSEVKFLRCDRCGEKIEDGQPYTVQKVTTRKAKRFANDPPEGALITETTHAHFRSCGYSSRDFYRGFVEGRNAYRPGEIVITDEPKKRSWWSI